MKTVEQFLKETAKANKTGIFGLDACKESIENDIELRRKYDKGYENKTDEEMLFEILQEYLARARRDIFFNPIMIQACWQLINGR